MAVYKWKILILIFSFLLCFFASIHHLRWRMDIYMQQPLVRLLSFQKRHTCKYRDVSQRKQYSHAPLRTKANDINCCERNKTGRWRVPPALDRWSGSKWSVHSPCVFMCRCAQASAQCSLSNSALCSNGGTWPVEWVVVTNSEWHMFSRIGDCVQIYSRISSAHQFIRTGLTLLVISSSPVTLVGLLRWDCTSESFSRSPLREYSLTNRQWTWSPLGTNRSHEIIGVVASRPTANVCCLETLWCLVSLFLACFLWSEVCSIFFFFFF